MRRFETYRFQDGVTPLDAETFNTIFGDIDTRVADVEALKPDLEESVADLLEVGLQRVQDSLGPLVARLQAAAEFGFLVALTNSNVSLTPGQTNGIAINDPDQRAVFTPTTFLTLASNTEPDRYGVIRFTGYNRVTGVLAFEVISTRDVGNLINTTITDDDWTVAASSAVLQAVTDVLAQVAEDRQATLAAVEEANEAASAAGGHRDATQELKTDTQTLHDETESFAAAAFGTGVLLTWDDGNTDANPGAGKARASNDLLSIAAVLYVSKTNRAGNPIGPFLLRFGNPASVHKGDLIITRQATQDQTILSVTGVTDATGYVKIALNSSEHAGLTGLSGDDSIALQWFPNGDDGENGIGAGNLNTEGTPPTDEIAVFGTDPETQVKGSGYTVTSIIAAAVAVVRDGVTGAFDTLSEIVTALSGHLANVTNPHSTTKAQVGLGNVTNVAQTADPTGNGLVVKTGAGTAVAVTITGPAVGVTVANGDGTGGNPTISLGNDIAALEALGSTGFAVRTASDTWAQRSFTGTSGKITVTNPAGIAGDPVFNVGADIADLAVANQFAGLTEKTSLVDDDLLLMEDSATGGAKKKVKKVNLAGTVGARYYAPAQHAGFGAI